MKRKQTAAERRTQRKRTPSERVKLTEEIAISSWNCSKIRRRRTRNCENPHERCWRGRELRKGYTKAILLFRDLDLLVLHARLPLANRALQLDCLEKAGRGYDRAEEISRVQIILPRGVNHSQQMLR